jgi:hypothetical protein
MSIGCSTSKGFIKAMQRDEDALLREHANPEFKYANSEPAVVLRCPTHDKVHVIQRGQRTRSLPGRSPKSTFSVQTLDSKWFGKPYQVSTDTRENTDKLPPRIESLLNEAKGQLSESDSRNSHDEHGNTGQSSEPSDDAPPPDAPPPPYSE